MKSYSRAGLLGEETWIHEGRLNWLDKIAYRLNKATPVVFKIEIPLNLYLRAEILCEDIEELAETSFKQNDLLNLLYNEFLQFIKKNPDPNKVYEMLTSLEDDEELSYEVKGFKQTFKPIKSVKEQKTESVLITMRRKHALRGEVMLADLEEVYPNHGYTLEKVFELLYCDFIRKIRKGLTPEAINKILSLLVDDD